MNQRPTREQREYWSRLVERGCLICRGPAEVAHAHGGSIVERMQEPKAKGVKLRRLHWLALPLCVYHHRLGPDALDNGVRQWERQFGNQADWIDILCSRYQRDLWALARDL